MDSLTGSIARLRGALVGATSGAVGIAAHAISGGGLPPTESSVVLLLMVCAAFGAAVASWNVVRLPIVALTVTLAAGQLIGHATLALAAEHSHGLQLTGAMAGGHAAAIAVSAALILGAERAYAVGVSTLLQALPILVAPTCADTYAVPSLPAYRAKVARWLLVSAGTGTRGPPLFV